MIELTGDTVSKHVFQTEGEYSAADAFYEH